MRSLIALLNNPIPSAAQKAMPSPSVHAGAREAASGASGLWFSRHNLFMRLDLGLTHD